MARQPPVPLSTALALPLRQTPRHSRLLQHRTQVNQPLTKTTVSLYPRVFQISRPLPLSFCAVRSPVTSQPSWNTPDTALVRISGHAAGHAFCLRTVGLNLLHRFGVMVFFFVVIRRFVTFAGTVLWPSHFQNDLTELYALLHYLFPDIFDQADVFAMSFHLNAAGPKVDTELLSKVSPDPTPCSPSGPLHDTTHGPDLRAVGYQGRGASRAHQHVPPPQREVFTQCPGSSDSGGLGIRKHETYTRQYKTSRLHTPQGPLGGSI